MVVEILRPERNLTTVFVMPTTIRSFGPDPYLTAEAGYETIVGVQSVGVQACAKHFLANNQEHWRYGLSADVDDRTTQELYMYPYYRAVEVRPLIPVLLLGFVATVFRPTCPPSCARTTA